MINPSDKMTIGPWKGQKMSSLSRSSLEWIVKNLTGGDWDEYAQCARRILKSPELSAEVSSENLDDAATEFLRKHGVDMPAERGRVYRQKGRPAKFQKWRRKK